MSTNEIPFGVVAEFISAFQAAGGTTADILSLSADTGKIEKLVELASTSASIPVVEWRPEDIQALVAVHVATDDSMSLTYIIDNLDVEWVVSDLEREVQFVLWHSCQPNQPYDAAVIGEFLGIKPATAKVRQSRAFEELSRRLKLQQWDHCYVTTSAEVLAKPVTEVFDNKRVNHALSRAKVHTIDDLVKRDNLYEVVNLGFSGVAYVRGEVEKLGLVLRPQ